STRRIRGSTRFDRAPPARSCAWWTVCPARWPLPSCGGTDGVAASRQDAAVSVFLAVLGFALYSYRAQDSPPTVAEQPLRAAAELLTSRSGHDQAGRFLPLFVEVGPELWLPPASPYATSVMRTVWPAGQPERRSAATCGALGVALTYVFALLLFRQRALTWTAALLMLTNPAYVTVARTAVV